MKVAAILIAALLSPTFSQAQIIYQRIMTNATVEALVHKGVPAETIIRTIRTARAVDFLVDNHEAFLLVRAGASDPVSEQILEAMQQRVENGPISPAAAASIAPAPARVLLAMSSVREASAPLGAGAGSANMGLTRSKTSGETPMAEPPAPPPPAESPSNPTIELGQTIEQVINVLGQPSRIVKLSAKEIYFFSNLKITLTGGKVSDVD